MDYQQFKQLRAMGLTPQQIADFEKKSGQVSEPATIRRTTGEKLRGLVPAIGKGVGETMTKFLPGVLRGGAKGALSTISGMSAIGQRGLEGIGGFGARQLGLREPRRTETLREKFGERLRPRGDVEKGAFMAEQLLGEFALPTKAVAGMYRGGMKLGGRMATEAGIFGGITAAQKGKVDEEARTAAMIGAAFPLFGAGVRVFGRKLIKGGEKIQQTVIKPSRKDIKDGFKIANVTKYNLGGDLKQVLARTTVKLNTLGNELKSKLAGSRKDVNLNKIYQRTAQRMLRRPAESFGGAGQTERTLKTLKNEIERVSKSGVVDVPTAQMIKRKAGENGSWAYGMLDREGKAKEQVYTTFYQYIKRAIEKSSPKGVKEINKQLSEIIPIHNAVIKRIPVAERNQAIGLLDTIGLTASMFEPKAMVLLGARWLSTKGKFGKALIGAGRRISEPRGAVGERILGGELKDLKGIRPGLTIEDVTKKKIIKPELEKKVKELRGVRKGLLKKGIEKDYKLQEEIVKGEARREAGETALTERWKGIKSAIFQSTYFRKQRTFSDKWIGAPIYQKGDVYRFALTDKQKADLMSKGYKKYGSIDEMASAANMDAEKFLEKAFEETMEGRAKGSGKIAHEWMMDNSKEYFKLDDEISKITQQLKNLSKTHGKIKIRTKPKGAETKKIRTGVEAGKVKRRGEKFEGINYKKIAEKLPDSDKPSETTTFKKVGDKIVYTEGWCDRCFENVIDEIGRDRSALVNYARKKTPEIAKSQTWLPQNKNLKGYKLSDYKFIETPSKDLNYGVTVAVYEPIKKVGLRKAPEGFKGLEGLTLKTVEKLKGSTTVSKEHILNLSNAPDLKQAERDLVRRILDDMPAGKINVKDFANKVKTELLPLKTETGKVLGYKAMQYENITLPAELRGNIAKYNEVVYQSPIKTSAGSVHFEAETFPNYFAHTRIEDLAPRQGTFQSNLVGTAGGKVGNTRRIIELQSDLFQKGGLALEGDKIPGSSGLFPKPKASFVREKELAKIDPYRNTWHERIIKEEIKQAAKDGKTKLQFPTGKTAMKVEGLGGTVAERTSWKLPQKEFSELFERGEVQSVFLTPRQLKVGKEIVRDREGSKWIVTDVLGDGKFKAMPKKFWEDKLLVEKEIKRKTPRFDDMIEQFDISGKVDTSNPIFKFYEKEIQKYLKRLRPEMKRITDKQGVDWFEIGITKQDLKAPIEAFGIIGALGFQGLRMQNENKLRGK